MAGRIPLPILLCLLLAAPGAAAADDPGQIEKGKTLVATLAALRKACDATGLQGELKGVVELHNALGDKALKGKLQKELGAALKSRKLSDVHPAVVKALSELDDSKGAFKQLKRFVPSPKEEEVAPIKMDALKAVAALAPDGALKALYDLGEKAKHRPAAIAAIAALGHFRASKKRTAIVEELVKLILRFIPPRNVQSSEETLKRWNDLAPPLVGALNQLTGQKVRDPEEWLQLWREHKKKPQDLFLE